MEREDFLKCRNEIVGVLQENRADYIDAICIVSSALNDILAPRRMQAIISCRDLPAYHGNDEQDFLARLQTAGDYFSGLRT